MQVIRQERRAKAQGLGLIGLMLLVAASVHYWPAGERAEPATSVEPAVVVTAAPPAAAVPASVAARPAQDALRRAELQFRRVRPSAPQTVASGPRPMFKPDDLPLATLSGLPGTAAALPDRAPAASFVPTLASPLAPAPSTVVETQPGGSPQRSGGALTVAAKATGKGLAVAFQKTGAAFRRVF
jgi:hypothetical protein